MDGINRVKLSRYRHARGMRMLKCANGAELALHAEQFRKLAAASFEARDYMLGQAREELCLYKYRGYWVSEHGVPCVLVYAYDAEHALQVAGQQRDYYGTSDDTATLETSVRPSAGEWGRVIAWASDLELMA